MMFTKQKLTQSLQAVFPTFFVLMGEATALPTWKRSVESAFSALPYLMDGPAARHDAGEAVLRFQSDGAKRLLILR